MDLIDLFTKNISPRQNQYEALRALAFQEGSVEEIAARFGYTPQSLRTLAHRVLSGKQQIFPEVKRGPQKPQTSPDTINDIIHLRRKRRLNAQEISVELVRSSSVKSHISHDFWEV